MPLEQFNHKSPEGDQNKEPVKNLGLKLGISLAVGAAVTYGILSIRKVTSTLEVEKPEPLPLTVTYNEDLDTAPYSISFDKKGYVDFLHQQGMENEMILKRAVQISRRPSRWQKLLGEPTGTFNPLTNSMSIYTDWAWRTKGKNIDEINQKLNSTLSHETGHMIDFQHTRYKFVRSLEQSAMILSTLALLDYQTPIGQYISNLYGNFGVNLFYATALFVDFVSFGRFIYLMSPIEYRARRFTKQPENNLQVIKMTSK